MFNYNTNKLKQNNHEIVKRCTKITKIENIWRVRIKKKNLLVFNFYTDVWIMITIKCKLYKIIPIFHLKLSLS